MAGSGAERDEAMNHSVEHVVVSDGAVLAGKYRVERVLGQGGMGMVVKATHLHLHQPVAIKLLLPEMLGHPQLAHRFLREAQAAVRLKSEHVARVIDVGSLESGAPYMVLEYLEGADLASVSRSQLSVGAVVDLMLQACEALSEAHSLGIVHRDIKPANLFITRGADGIPLLKVLDFGISKIPVAGSSLTATNVVMGTPTYMSPEQMRSSRDVDHRSDIWALGIVLYELLQGTPPFGSDTFSSMIVKVVTEPLPPFRVPLPGDLDTVVYRCLEKQPERRFQNIAELVRGLAPYARTATQAEISVQRTSHILGLEAHPALPIKQPLRQSAPSTLSAAAGARTALPSAGRRWMFFAGLGALSIVALAIIVATGLAGGAAHTGRPSHQRTDSQETIHAARPAPSRSVSVQPPPPPFVPAAPSAPTQTAPSAPTSAQSTTRATQAVSPQPAAPPHRAGPSPGSRAVIGTDAADFAKKIKRTRSATAGSAAEPAIPPSDDDVLGTRN